MERFGAVTTVCVVALIGVVLAPNARAGAWNRKSEKTFTEQVEIPGVHLSWMGSFSCRNLWIQPDKTVVTFRERPTGEAEALGA